MKIILFIALSSFLFSSNVKEAFMEGIKESIKVLNYEKSIQNKPVPSGYCISVKKNRDTFLDSEILKIESYALLVNLFPSYLKSNDKALLCVATRQSKEDIEQVYKKISKNFKRFTDYTLSIETIPPFDFHRELPALGIVSENYQVTSRIINNEKQKQVKPVYKSENIKIFKSEFNNIFTIESIR